MLKIHILGLMVLAISISYTPTVDSLQCYMCHSHNETNCEYPDPKETTTVECENTEPVPKTANEFGDIVPMCITVIYEVLQEYEFKIQHSDTKTGISKLKMLKPEVKRFCGRGNGTTEANMIIRRNSLATKYFLETCTTDDLCNNSPPWKPSMFGVYVLSALATLAAIGIVSWIVYRKTGCQFNRK